MVAGRSVGTVSATSTRWVTRGSVGRQLAKYRFVLGWVGRDFLWRYRGRVASILGARFAGLAFQVGTFGLLAYYARLLEGDRALTLGAAQLAARDSVALLGIVGALASLALVASSFLTLRANRWTIELSGEYEELCGRRALAIASRSIRLETPETVEAEGEQRLLGTMIRKYPRLLRMMVRILVSSLIPAALTAALFLPVLFYLSFWLSAIVVSITAVSAMAHYRLSLRAAESSMTLERTSEPAFRPQREAVEQLSHRLEELDEGALDAPFSAPAFRQNAAAYTDRMMATDESQFVSDLATAIVIVTVLVALGGRILLDGEGWSSLIVYLLVLRYSMGQMKSVFAGLAGINRFFHQVRAYFLFLEGQHELLPVPSSEGIEELDLRCRDTERIPGATAALTVRPGQRVTVLQPDRLTRFRLFDLFHQILAEAPDILQRAMASTQLHTPEESRGVVAPTDPAGKAPSSSPGPAGGRGRIVVASTLIAPLATEGDGAPEHPFAHDFLIVVRDRFDLSAVRWADVVVVSDGEQVVWLGSAVDAPALRTEIEAVIRKPAGDGPGDPEEDD